jgi:hypothetical protein
MKSFPAVTATIWMSPSSPPQDLNTLLPTNSGWILGEAYSIDDSGEIVGSGLLTNATAEFGYILHAFALVPVTKAVLNIERAGTNVILTWSAGVHSFTLESTANLVSPTVWSAVFPLPVVVNGLNTVTNPIAAATRFYRLSQ